MMRIERNLLKNGGVLLVALFGMALAVSSRTGWTEETQTGTPSTPATSNPDETVPENPGKQPQWNNVLKTKYGLPDSKIAELRKKGFNGPEIVKLAELAKLSGKQLDEIAKMRQEQKMGWGKIAKDLGVFPGALGTAVSAAAKDMKDDGGRAAKGEKHDKKLERKNERKEHKMERKEKNAGKKMKNH